MVVSLGLTVLFLNDKTVKIVCREKTLNSENAEFNLEHNRQLEMERAQAKDDKATFQRYNVRKFLNNT